MNNIYWKHYDTYHIIEDEPLTHLADKYGTKLYRRDDYDKEVRDWFNFAHIMSKKYELNVMYSACFIYYVTMYFTGVGISAGAEEEYFLKKLDDKIYSIYRESMAVQVLELDQKRCFFKLLVKLFLGDEIISYEKKVFQHNIRVNAQIKRWADGFPSMREAVVQVLYGYVDKPHLSMYDGEYSGNLVFMLRYSEETVWRSLSKLGDVDRLRVLLF